MNGVVGVLNRELHSYFFSPLAYVILSFLLLVNGGVFWLIVSFLNNPRFSPSITPLELFFGQTVFFWLVLLIVAPALTMRSLSEERRSGTLEALMTAPVTEGQVVLGKYAAALVFYLFLWAPTLAYALILDRYTEVDWGPVAAGYLGIVGVGAVFLAVGTFASALARSQLVAALGAFAMLMAFFSFGLLENLFNNDTAREVFSYLNVWDHMTDLSKGVVDTRLLVYYTSVSALFLFLSARALEAKKWR